MKLTRRRGCESERTTGNRNISSNALFVYVESESSRRYQVYEQSGNYRMGYSSDELRGLFFRFIVFFCPNSGDFSHPCAPPASPNSDFFWGVRNQAQRQEGALEVIAQTSLHQPVAASRRSSSPSVRGECGPQVPSFIPSLGSDLFANW